MAIVILTYHKPDKTIWSKMRKNTHHVQITEEAILVVTASDLHWFLGRRQSTYVEKNNNKITSKSVASQLTDIHCLQTLSTYKNPVTLYNKYISISTIITVNQKPCRLRNWYTRFQIHNP